MAALAERAREALAEEPIQVGDVSIELTLSVGAALATGDRRTPDALVHAADQALYRGEGRGAKLRPDLGYRRPAQRTQRTVILASPVPSRS